MGMEGTFRARIQVAIVTELSRLCLTFRILSALPSHGVGHPATPSPRTTTSRLPSLPAPHPSNHNHPPSSWPAPRPRKQRRCSHMSILPHHHPISTLPKVSISLHIVPVAPTTTTTRAARPPPRPRSRSSMAPPIWLYPSIYSRIHQPISRAVCYLI